MTIKLFKDLKKYTLTSTLTKEDYDTVKKYRPQELKRQDKDGNDLFAISYVGDRPNVSANGITFGSVSNEGGYLLVRGDLPETLPAGTTYAEYVADKVGAAIPYIEDFEGVLPVVVAQIRDERANLVGSIVEA